jgi:hypothetical protein
MDWLDNFWGFLFGLAQFGFCAGIVFLAAMSFGVEFHHRTFAMLLSQPAERFRIWRDKMLVLAGIIPAVAIVAMLYYVVEKPPSEHDPATTALGVLFVVFIVLCSTAFWTLAARSTIGGVVFSLSVMFMGGGILQAVLERLVGTAVDATPEAIARRNFLMGAPMVAAGLLYSGICLWLGWHKFARMELRDAQSGDAIPFPKAFPGAKWIGNLLRCRPTGALRNLVRKELHLHKPIFLLAILFTISWLGILGWSWLFPEQITRPAALLAVSFIFLLFVAILTGCAAFDEERTLGVTAWHLTLPPSAMRQWFVKFLLSASVFVLLGCCLPLLLALLLSPETRGLILQGIEEAKNLGWIGVCGFLFILSFWAASLAGNMVRAALTMILTCFAIAMLGGVAQWIAGQLGGLQSGLVEFIGMKLQWSPRALHDFRNTHTEWPFLLVPAVVCFAALLQSHRCFRTPQTTESVRIRWPLKLSFIAFLIFLWSFDLSVSADRAFKSLNTKLSAVVQSLHLKEADFPVPGTPARKITLAEFENSSDPVPIRVKEWLRNSTIELDHLPPSSRPSAQHAPTFWITFNFPSTRSDRRSDHEVIVWPVP